MREAGAAPSALLASRSQRGRKIPHLLIAVAAEDHRLTVLHDDQDFDKIPKLTGQPCGWVVPADAIAGRERLTRHPEAGSRRGPSEVGSIAHPTEPVEPQEVAFEERLLGLWGQGNEVLMA